MEKIESYVIVSNCGIVFTGSKTKALSVFRDYREISQLNIGRAGGERVTLFCGNEIEKDFIPKEYEEREEIFYY